MRASQACRIADDRGLAPADLAGIAAVLLACRDRWRRPGAPAGEELGVLFLRLSEARPGQDWSDLALWPPATAAHRQREEAASRARARDETAARRRADEAAARRTADDDAARLEAAHGAALDALDAAALDALAASLPPILRRMFAEADRARAAGSLVRHALLERLAAANAGAEP